MPISFRPTSTNISSILFPTSTPVVKSVKLWVGQTLTNIKGRITSTIVSQAAAETQLRPGPKTPTTQGPASNKRRAPPLAPTITESTPTTPMSPPMPPFFEQGRNSTGSSLAASTNTVITRPMGNYLDDIIKGRSQLKSTNVNA